MRLWASDSAASQVALRPRQAKMQMPQMVSSMPCAVPARRLSCAGSGVVDLVTWHSGCPRTSRHRASGHASTQRRQRPQRDRSIGTAWVRGASVSTLLMRRRAECRGDQERTMAESNPDPRGLRLSCEAVASCPCRRHSPDCRRPACRHKSSFTQHVAANVVSCARRHSRGHTQRGTGPSASSEASDNLGFRRCQQRSRTSDRRWLVPAGARDPRSRPQRRRLVGDARRFRLQENEILF